MRGIAKRQVEPLRQPAGEAHVVGVEMRHQHRLQALAPQRAGQHGVPTGAALVGGDAGVEDEPATLVLDEIDVHMVQLERKVSIRNHRTPGAISTVSPGAGGAACGGMSGFD